MTCPMCQREPMSGDTLCGDCGERAAIMEHDGGMTREAAEAAARVDVQRRAWRQREHLPAAAVLTGRLW